MSFGAIPILWYLFFILLKLMKTNTCNYVTRDTKTPIKNFDCKLCCPKLDNSKIMYVCLFKINVQMYMVCML
jgi:hypothetical protein